MSKQLDFQTAKGTDFTFSIPEPGHSESFFIFSLPKAGSTLLMNIMSDVCKALEFPILDLPTRIFSLGIQPMELTEDINRLWQEHGYAYLGFRLFLPTMTFDFSKTKNILLIRDPRDMLVSLYFSIKYSHVVPKLKDGDRHPVSRQRELLKDSGIDQTVISQAPAIKSFFKTYMTNLPATTTRVYRYEDIIFKKKEWIEDILDFLGLELSQSKIRAIAEKHDIRPDKENPKKHIRQVTPGNYKTHLSQATIEKLDDIFRPVLRNFHYDSVTSLKIGTNLNEKSVQNPHKSVDAKDDKIQRLERNIDVILQSWSWRSTGPLRTLASIFEKKG